jgi:hypothetical protein
LPDALEPAVATTLRAAAEVFVPGPPHDATPGAADVEAERFIAHYLDLLIPGLSRGATDLLDELAAQEFGGRAFAALSPDERGVVLDRLGDHEVAQLRELPAVLGLLSIAAVYGEWTGTDEEGRLSSVPLGWELTGFDGPTRARPTLLGGS